MEPNVTYGAVKRTHSCGELTSEHLGQEVIIAGWVHKWRDLGNLIFIDLRDRRGLAQIVFSADDSQANHELASKLRNEFVIAVRGTVKPRPEGMINPDMETGEIEVEVHELNILNTSKTPPFPVSQASTVNEETRLKYRYVDLRSERMKKNIMLRHHVSRVTREYLQAHDFVEIETPMLMKSTPEGARDYIVPSRIHPGHFYALPQSPQLYKQLLMMSGFERYFQIARCLRDEDLRGDKQPEHTQIDIEMSFVTQDDVFNMVEGLFVDIFRQVMDIDIPKPFVRIPYQQALDRYGIDKPDIRFDLELTDATTLVQKMDFKLFHRVLDEKGIVKGLRVPGGSKLSRKDIETWENDIKTYYDAKGLAWVKVDAQKFRGPIAKFFDQEALDLAYKTFEAEEGDLLLFVAGKPKVVYQSLADLRLKTARYLNCIPPNEFRFLWVTDFPIFEWDDENDKWEAAHHLFSMPKLEHLELLETDPGHVHGQVYDLVLNGVELASGSIRIHNRALQERIFNVVGITPEDAQRRFGFFLNALEYGAPPHGGIAPGLDRILMLMAHENTIRDVIPFPKTLNAASPLDDCPSPVDDVQLKETHIRLDLT
ncbi:aspartate--tRNA ligase [candidate division CSSED10-310 bacterium]|uniref:Aspartate--tRNA(Asp/Asn) ligase n=1 Tax=candidate division CSSED10-310 bacterium TaxID=2855610 RepID=A0ABV6YUH7_UNCC1